MECEVAVQGEDHCQHQVRPHEQGEDHCLLIWPVRTLRPNQDDRVPYFVVSSNEGQLWESFVLL